MSKLNLLRGAWFAATFSLCLSSYAGDDGEGVLLKVEMRPKIQANRSLITLADVASLSSVNLDLLRRAMVIPLGNIPRSGDVVFLDGGNTKRWLRRQIDLRDEQIQWTGAAITEIHTEHHQIGSEELVAAAQASLRKHLEQATAEFTSPSHRIELQPLFTPISLSIPTSVDSWRVRPMEGMPIGKRMLVWVDLFSGDRFVRALPVRFDVSVFAKAYVATASLSMGQTLQASQLEARDVDYFQRRDNTGASPVFFDANTLAAKRLRRGVQAGKIVTQADLQVIPAVSRGEWASLTSKNGLVTLESRVEVLQDGQVGQTVRVKPFNASSAVLARVSGVGHLELQQ